MEEMVGRWWHHAVTKVARQDYPAAAVQLQDMQKCIGILFRAAGGPAALRFSAASQQAVGGHRLPEIVDAEHSELVPYGGFAQCCVQFIQRFET